MLARKASSLPGRVTFSVRVRTIDPIIMHHSGFPTAGDICINCGAVVPPPARRNLAFNLERNPGQ